MKLLSIELTTERYKIRIFDSAIKANAHTVAIMDTVEDDQFYITIEGIHSLLTFVHLTITNGDAHISEFIKAN